MSRKYKTGDIMQLPVAKIGIIREVVTKQLDWHPYKIEILRDRVFGTEGEIEDYKEENIEKLM